MTPTTAQFDSKVLRRSKSESDFNLYRAALEWGLIDPIVIESSEDLKSKYRWEDRVSPYKHQVTNLITFCRRLPVSLLADDVGLGKTISAGLIASELISRGRLTKILIVCPKILRDQWQEELRVKFDIQSVIVTGQELVKVKPPEEGGAVITTYNTARLYLDKIEKVGYEMLILDEAHKLRNLYGTDAAPKVALKFKKALADRLFQYVLMLTATPIHNRLWDIYSLIDLLAVARGHENPFGQEGIFARKYIEGDKIQARRLRLEAKEEFRDNVYRYMSRIRRGDTDLSFPERVIQLHPVEPSAEEVELLNLIREPIKEVNFLSQITILQTFVSSPEALLRVLENMALNKTLPKSLQLQDVKAIVSRIKITAKLKGLGILIEKLSQEKPEDWRAVIFTTRRETQTTIQHFLQQKGISCGLINGDSGSRNQDTIANFTADVPKIHVIVSTEAGSEGVNLQKANVLVNYDLPWNPMIVEQRIGRIQRLSSKFAKVSIFNIILKGTFEEYIVARLVEKLQMASNAIGDIEALLEASGIDDDDNDSDGFADKIGKLVLASLAGMDVQESTLRIEKSIEDAKFKLEQEKQTINTLLGSMNGAEDMGPKCPKLPTQVRSINVQSFVMQALESLGVRIEEKSGQRVAVSENQQEVIRFSDEKVDPDLISTLYAPGTPAFERLVSRVAARDLHLTEDVDTDIINSLKEISCQWAEGFEGEIQDSRITETWRCFQGSALVRVRATVACDSYERLIDIDCSPEDHCMETGKYGLDTIGEIIDQPSSVGVVTKHLYEKALMDEGISEFSRFYTERRAQEISASGSDERKRKKVEDDFTPRLDIVLVGLKGTVYRKIKTLASYKLSADFEYQSSLLITPYTNTINQSPDLVRCDKTGRMAPQDCIAKCEISGSRVLRHLLVASELSGRLALPEHILICSLSTKRVLIDEADKSSITGKMITKNLLYTSAVSGKTAEPEFFSKCEFTDTHALEAELEISQVSGKKFRVDEQLRSHISGKIGHKQEFIFCAETNVPLLPTEAETCEVTGKVVVPGLLEKCEVTGKMVLPDLLEKSALSSKKALKKYFVASNLSNANILEQEAIRSAIGNFCTPQEARLCSWSGKLCHPDDLRICDLTGLEIEFEYATSNGGTRLGPLVLMLDGVSRKGDFSEHWRALADNLTKALGGGRANIEAATLSPNKQNIAVCAEVRTWVGLQTRHTGFVFSVSDNSIIGRVVQGKRVTGGWSIR